MTNTEVQIVFITNYDNNGQSTILGFVTYIGFSAIHLDTISVYRRAQGATPSETNSRWRHVVATWNPTSLGFISLEEKTLAEE